MSTSSCQLEIIFLTCRTAISVTKHIDKFSKNIELDNLKVSKSEIPSVRWIKGGVT